MHQFMSLTPAKEALANWMIKFKPLEPAEEVPILDALGRVTAFPVQARSDLPGFSRSTVDGYAVRARDTFGASEGLPAMLTLTGEVAIGRPAGFSLAPGQTAWVPTGGALPEGSDAVVMLEHSEALGDQVQISRAVAPGENALSASEDITRGSEAVPRGRRIGPGEIGLLAGLGVTHVPVTPRPRVMVLSTGDEVVPAGNTPQAGQVRDINGYTLSALVRMSGASLVGHRWVPDDEDALTGAIKESLGQAHMVVLSGGSSVGNRDFTLNAINRAGAPGVLVHGIAIRPGKPTVLGVVSEVPVLGLPGHPVSAVIAWRVFGPHALGRLQGLLQPPGHWVRRAVLDSNLVSAPGREDFYCMRLIESDGTLRAIPILGKSGLISNLVAMDGLLRIAPDREGMQAGEIVEVESF